MDLRFLTSRRRQWFIIPCAIILQAGCERRGIEVYSVGKNESSPPLLAAEAPAVKLPEAPPDGWVPIDTAGGPRVASFRLEAGEPGSEPGDLSVTVFPGTVGGLLANVNRWRGELGQSEVTQEELHGVLDVLQIDGHELHRLNVAGGERGMIGGILPLGTETWFFKLTGSMEVVEKHRRAFDGYLRGLEIGGAAGSASMAEVAHAPDRPRLTYRRPEGWVEGEPTAMRVASFTVTASEDREADIAVIPLGGSGGARLAIINQWRSSLRLDDATEGQLPSMMETLRVGGRDFQLVDFESAEAMLDGDRKARILVAFAAVGEHTWFFKITGETSLVAAQRPVLLEFLKSAEFDAS